MNLAFIHRHSFHIYICLLSTSIHKERSLSVSRRLPQFTVEKYVLEFLNDLKFILYLKYDNFSTTCCMTRLPLLPIIYVRAHYIIQLEIHKNTSYFSGNTDAAVNKKNNKITRKKYTRFFLVLSVSNINISDDKVHNFVVNIVDLNEFISLNTTKDSKFILGYFDWPIRALHPIHCCVGIAGKIWGVFVYFKLDYIMSSDVDNWQQR